MRVAMFLLLLSACNPDRDHDGFTADVDCDDTRADVNPEASEVAGNGVDDDCSPETCIQTGFSDDYEAWALPQGYSEGTEQPFYFTLSFAPDCDADSTQPHYGQTFDITGDGLPDLVIYSMCDGSLPQGQWRVHRNTGNGFAQEAEVWQLPTEYADEEQAFLQESHWSSCTEEHAIPGWFLWDMDGDDTLDLVVTRICDDATLGATAWKVFRGTGTGFAQTGETWALPSGYAPEGTFPFTQAGAESDCHDTSLPGY